MFRFAALLATLLILCFPLHAVDIQDTRLLTQPAVSADRIAFSYANDLWVANVDGSGVREQQRTTPELPAQKHRLLWYPA